VFQNTSVALETFCFRKVNPFCVINSLFRLAHLILPMAFVSRWVIVFSLGVFYSMSLISNNKVSEVSDDLELYWISADLVTNINPVPPYFG